MRAFAASASYRPSAATCHPDIKRAFTAATCVAVSDDTSQSAADPEAGFARMLLREAAGLRRYARWLTASPADAEDLVQDTLLRCWRWQSGYERGTNFVGWTRTVMRNTFLTGLKRRRLEVDVPDDVLHAIRIVDPNQSFALELREAHQALERLPEKQRSAIILASGGTSVQDGAAMLAIPANTYKSLVRRGRERLKQMLDGQHPMMVSSVSAQATLPPEKAVLRKKENCRRKLIIG
jgi:RNA polymerase sigma factor (sigma-70 family)